MVARLIAWAARAGAIMLVALALLIPLHGGNCADEHDDHDHGADLAGHVLCTCIAHVVVLPAPIYEPVTIVAVQAVAQPPVVRVPDTAVIEIEPPPDKRA